MLPRSGGVKEETIFWSSEYVISLAELSLCSSDATFQFDGQIARLTRSAVDFLLHPGTNDSIYSLAVETLQQEVTTIKMTSGMAIKENCIGHLPHLKLQKLSFSPCVTYSF